MIYKHLTKSFALALFSITISISAFSQDSLINYYNKKVLTYLDKQKALSPYYLIDKSGIKIFASSYNKSICKTEFAIDWHQLQAFKTVLKNCNQTKVAEIYSSGKFSDSINCIANHLAKKLTNNIGFLSGYKIAIDAGHVAGDFVTGQIEQKFLKFGPNPSCNIVDSIFIAEGVLTYATASLLKDSLEKYGAAVFLTRPFNGSTAFGITFEDWLKDNFNNTIEQYYRSGKISMEKKKWYLTKATKREKFRLVFKDIDLRKRAEIINDYQPDFTIIIHFNVDETNTGWTKPGNKNFNMAFVGGAFMGGDLSNIDKRFEFLRLLITNELEESIILSSKTLNSFEKNLGIKTASFKDATYLPKGCLSTEKNGVYCRNLQLTRYIHSPLVYGETLYQDNINECVLLNKEIDKTKNKRVQEIANAYFIGVKNYIEVK
ncbi:MAG: N-acetylmuramoyl-L-alanine amidase [Bacteroidia bacterium]